jgi:hypothetical protein
LTPAPLNAIINGVDALFEALDVFSYGVAVVGGALAILWIYNSTLKERRGGLRKKHLQPDPVLARQLKLGVLFQRLGFCAAALTTAAAILWFARAYYGKYGVNVAGGYLLLAFVFAAAGVAGFLLTLIAHNKE